MDKLQEKLNYKFKDVKLLKQALTHSSYANNNNAKSYERLEFLGDSILSFVISEYQYNEYEYQEGELSKMRASVVCEQSLADASARLSLGENLLLGKGEENTGGRTRASILADVFEAILAAIYLDGGIETAKKFVLDNLSETVTLAQKGKVNKDYKTLFQEVVQAQGQAAEYVITGEQGPEHNKTFMCNVIVQGVVKGQGRGKNKKEAEQYAAREAMRGQ